MLVAGRASATWTTAEEAMLGADLRAGRAGATASDILELGCGWGSLTLWMAARYPDSARSRRCPTPHRSGEFIRGARRATAGSAQRRGRHRRHERLRHRAPLRPGGVGGDVRAHAQLARSCSSASTAGSSPAASSSSTSSPTAAWPIRSRPRATTTGWAAISSPAA
ncbi:MAG: hypothetical protein MZW92_81505 [Comamonadaceae bacterium]|nr:hypothetical protein [Comamonadaceae bacterium]